MALPGGSLKITVGLIILFLQLFLYINSEYIYGVYAAEARQVLLVYFILITMVMASFATPLPTITAQPQDMMFFVLGFVATGIAVMLLPVRTAQLATFETVKLALGFGLLHSFVKAFNEEAVFRSILPRMMGGGTIADIASNVLFGIFHASMLQLQVAAGILTQSAALVAVFVLFVLGMVWAQVRNRWGLMGATGSHFAWNLAALGLLGQIFGMG